MTSSLTQRVQFFIEAVEDEQVARARGTGGQYVQAHGDFARVPQSGLERLSWWARAFQECIEQDAKDPCCSSSRQ